MADAVPEGIGRRLAVTVLVPIGVLLAFRLPMPGVPDELMSSPAGRNLSLFALGISPIISAYLTVELVALVVPPWNRLRHAGPAARAKLDTAARILTLLLAAFQSYGVATYLQGMPMLGVSVGSLPVVIATQVAAVALLYLAALWITRRGLVNGLLLLTAVFAVRGLALGVSSAIHDARVTGELDARWAVLLAVGVALPIVASVLALGGVTFGTADDAAKAQSPYRESGRKPRPLYAWVPVPASSIYPLAAAASLLMLPATLRNFDVYIPAPGPGLATTLWLGVLVALLGVLFSFLLQRPSAIVAVARRLGMAAPGSEDAARAALRRALLPTFLFLGCLVAARGILSSGATLGIAISTPLIVAVLLDLVASIRALRADPGRVVVWEERRPYAATAVCAGLRVHGIDAWPRGLLALGFLNFFAPYAPAEITVPASDAKQAGELLEGWFLREEAEPAPADAPAADETDRAPVPEWSLRRAVPLALTALVGVAALVVASRPVAKPIPGVASKLEIAAIDDKADPLAHATDNDLPDDVERRQEDLSLGLDDNGDIQNLRRTFGYARQRHGELIAQTHRRLLAWLSHFRLPAGDRFAVEDVYDTSYDDDSRKVGGARSYILRSPPILTNADIADVGVRANDDDGRPAELARPDCSVSITLTPGGAQRFLDATKRLIKKRMAIVVDGVVNSAPVVQSPIPGGHLQITMGSGAGDSCAEARRLAASLRGAPSG